jgi:hypothetical protein
MYTLYQTNYTEYNLKMKEMITNYGIRRSKDRVNKGLYHTLKRIL